jgi:hypothetical protein
MRRLWYKLYSKYVRNRIVLDTNILIVDLCIGEALEAHCVH